MSVACCMKGVEPQTWGFNAGILASWRRNQIKANFHSWWLWSCRLNLACQSILIPSSLHCCMCFIFAFLTFGFYWVCWFLAFPFPEFCWLLAFTFSWLLTGFAGSCWLSLLTLLLAVASVVLGAAVQILIARALHVFVSLTVVFIYIGVFRKTFCCLLFHFRVWFNMFFKLSFHRPLFALWNPWLPTFISQWKGFWRVNPLFHVRFNRLTDRQCKVHKHWDSKPW